MKIILISASPRKEKSHTFALAKEVLKGCNNNTNIHIETEIVHLRDFKIEFCIDCEMCHKNCLECPIKDDVRSIQDKMLLADGIVFASPNYISMITGTMKTLFDRSSHFIHCQRLLDKYTTGVVTSGSGNDTSVLNYIKSFALICGAQYVNGVSSSAMKVKEKTDEAFKVGKSLVLSIKNKIEFSDQIQIINNYKEHFKHLVEMRKNDWVGEYNYWLKKGEF